MKKHAIVLELYKKGLTIKEIAGEFSCSRQYISSVLIQKLPTYREEQQRRREKLREKKGTKVVSLVCKQCATTFTTTNSKRSFCSANCYYDNITKYYRRKPGESERDYQRNRIKASYHLNATRRELVKKLNAESYLRDKKKSHARSYLNQMVQLGRIIKPTQCSVCGAVPGETCSRIEAHHEDYTKPLEVIWLCTPCHYQADLKLGLRKKVDTKQKLLQNVSAA